MSINFFNKNKELFSKQNFLEKIASPIICSVIPSILKLIKSE